MTIRRFSFLLLLTTLALGSTTAGAQNEAPCPECDGSPSPVPQLDAESVACPDCAAELEIINPDLRPPEDEEDWGEDESSEPKLSPAESTGVPAEEAAADGKGGEDNPSDSY